MFNNVLNKSKSCIQITPNFVETPSNTQSYCLISLLDKRGEMPKKSGINWGQNPLNHTKQNDAYIPIRIDHIRAFPSFFPPKKYVDEMVVGNDPVELIWDDGCVMSGLLEGSQGSHIKYPKQISSFPSKSILGEYIRNRIGVKLGSLVTKGDLENYGRTDIKVSMISDGVYKLDFSV